MGLLLLLVLGLHCKPDPTMQQSDSIWQPPAHFPATVYSFEKNKLTTAGIALGRSLFHDPILSRDSSISCASCHQASASFSDPGKTYSIGIAGRVGKRNSPALFNLAWTKQFMWDGAVNHLDVLALAPLADPNEMDADLLEVLNRLRSQIRYKQAFTAAFGDSIINDQRFLWALAQYQLSLISANSPFDSWWPANQTPNLAVQQGWQLFQQYCASCHTPPMFTNGTYANNGLDTVFADAGRGIISLLASDTGKFKIPSLRQWAFTAPYMHDGRFASIEAVVRHYAESAYKQYNTTDERVKAIPVLSNRQQNDLIQFLHQLNDPAFGQREVQ